jgi:NAD(P)-dependent dehydrogenase (short-subunit alcohol dehydrogenase family)
MQGRNVLVTGGGSGIGFAAAERLVARGAHVTICGRDDSRLMEAVERLSGTVAIEGRGSVRRRVCDVTDEAAVVETVEFAASVTGGLDVVVASAGGGTVGPVLSLPVEEWRRVVDLNLTGTFLTLKHSAAVMARSGGGSFVAVSSLAGSVSHRHMAPYCAAKAGIEMLVAVAADELGASGIRVNAIAPSFVQTELMGIVSADRAIVDSYLENIPLGRLGTVEDTSAAIVFLASDESSWITGETIRVTGGHHVRGGPAYDTLSRALYGDPLA